MLQTFSLKMKFYAEHQVMKHENRAILAGVKRKKKKKPVTQLPVPVSLYCPLEASSSHIIITWEPVTGPDLQGPTPDLWN